MCALLDRNMACIYVLNIKIMKAYTKSQTPILHIQLLVEIACLFHTKSNY